MTTIRSILIANRGEIASRIIRTCQKMGIKSIAIYSDADKHAPYTREADLAVHVGESAPSKSYLDQDAIINIAKTHNADAIHPGYGFLSENPEFATKCNDSDIIFIGPNPEAIKAMGSKSNAKSIMGKHNVPLIPGYQGDDQSIDALTKEALKIGFPLLIKAVAGGGGKGMRIVHEATEIEPNLIAAQRESKAAFGNDELIIEKYIQNGRHIEFQIFGDKHGNTIHILERECSIQRRYQKIIEESPSPVMDDDLRQQMGQAALQAAKAINYDNAGTVEFIYDEDAKAFYFLEVNTRLQVEHPVTEAITGLDLVKMQIESAEGKPLSIQQEDIQADGYAVEARLYAEDASNNFNPAVGIVDHWAIPAVEGLRIETAVESGSEISVYYDPMIAKIIVWDNNRASAHRKMAYTLSHLKCQGLITNQDFLLHLFNQEEINSGRYNTNYLDKSFDPNTLSARSDLQLRIAAIGATLWQWNNRQKERSILKAVPSGWRNNRYSPQELNLSIGDHKIKVAYTYIEERNFSISVNGVDSDVSLVQIDANNISFEIDDVKYHGSISQQENRIYFHSSETGNIAISEIDRFPIKEKEKLPGGYEAPMPSTIIKVMVDKGQQVKAGDELMVISSMKMENTIIADTAGKVEEIFTEEGKNVEAGFLLLKLSEAS